MPHFSPLLSRYWKKNSRVFSIHSQWNFFYSFEDIGKKIGRDEVYVAAIFYGQVKAPRIYHKYMLYIIQWEGNELLIMTRFIGQAKQGGVRKDSSSTKSTRKSFERRAWWKLLSRPRRVKYVLHFDGRGCMCVIYYHCMTRLFFLLHILVSC